MGKVDKGMLSEHLFEALRDTLETMAFAEVLPNDSEEFNRIANLESVIWAKVTVNSDFMRSVELSLPAELAGELADTMYAGMVPDDFNASMDTVAELTNTLAGSLMLNLGSEAGSFRLEVPQKGDGVNEPIEGALVCECIIDEVHPVRAVIELA